MAQVVAPAASPLLAVGSTFIDLTPEWLKSFAIRSFGANDKAALLSGMLPMLRGRGRLRRVATIASIGAAAWLGWRAVRGRSKPPA